MLRWRDANCDGISSCCTVAVLACWSIGVRLRARFDGRVCGRMLVLWTMLLAGVALWPVWRTPDLGVRRYLAILAFVATGLSLFAFFHWSSAAAATPTTRAIEVLEDGYVGSKSCRSCHPGEHDSWQHSFHRTMTQVAARANLQADFERLELDWFGKQVVLEWRGEQLWTVFDRGGKRPAHVERPVEQLTGSHHLQVLWYSTGEGRELGPVPMCFKTEERAWIPLTSVFVLPPTFRDPPDPGAWNQSCTMCHTTAARPRVDIDRTDTHVSEFGIACEACHGPGEAHVAANHNPLRRWSQRALGSDDTIANPATLQPVRSAQVCGHCHSVAIIKQQHFDTWREQGSPYVPGQDLQRTHLVIGTDDFGAPEVQRELRNNQDFFKSSFWSDGQVRLSGREFNGMRQSPCYTHGDADRQIDCTSCHRMHPEDGKAMDEWRDDQLQAGMRGNVGCTQCHEAMASAAGLQAHTHHGAESSGSNCYNCHMSHTSIGLMKASRSHAITTPSVDAELATGRPNACNQCHLDRTLQWTAEQLKQNWGVPPPPLTAEQQQVAAGVRWLLTGDAGQRTLAAWSFAWSPAQTASGSDWMAPYLARLLDDPYYVVRFNAARALRSLEGYGDALNGYQFIAEQVVQKPFVDNVTALWQSRFRGGANAAVLIAADGLMQARFAELYARRDDRPVYIAE